MSDTIKTTARFHEPDEPVRQRPIIQIDRPLPNTVRASLDSGRDNPFRPDGAIYKSADPIVDYYKYGPNQSRAQTPTDSQLLLNSGSGKKDKKKRKRRKKETAGDGDDEQGGDGKSRKPCWRRWLCCCCCCCRSGDNSKSGGEEEEEAKKATIDKGEEDEEVEVLSTKIAGGRETPRVVISTATTATSADPNIASEERISVQQRQQPSAIETRTRDVGGSNFKLAQAKIVVLKDSSGNDVVSDSNMNGSEKSNKNSISMELANEPAPTQAQSTQVKSAKSNRCVVS